MAGFRSYAFWWFTGYAVPVEPGCPCPEYGHDATLVNNFTQEETLVNQFAQNGTLINQFTGEQTLSNQFDAEVTLVTQWNRGGCNG